MPLWPGGRVGLCDKVIFAVGLLSDEGWALEVAFAAHMGLERAPGPCQYSSPHHLTDLVSSGCHTLVVAPSFALVKISAFFLTVGTALCKDGFL